MGKVLTMITIRAGSRAIAVCLLLLTGGCSREQQDWHSAEAADTIESYDQFIQRHPESELTTQARARVAQLGEERDWQRAGSADTADAYRQFLADHPNGKWAQEARIRIENFSLGEQASANALSQGASAVAAAPEAASAQPPPTATVKPPPVMSSSAGYGIQLGAFKTEAGADSEWHSLTTRFRPELAGLQEHVVAVNTPSGRIYRLQAAVKDEGQARALCETLKKRSQACVAVLPH